MLLLPSRGIEMTEKFKKEEQFLRTLADAYITHKADDLLSWLPDDFGYDSMWVLDSIKTKEQYKNYIIDKLRSQEKYLCWVEFAMMKDKRTGQPVLVLTRPVEDEKGPGAFVATSDAQGNIKRLDLTAAAFYPLEPISDDNIIKRTYKTILDTESNCGVNFVKTDGTVSKYKGVIVRGASESSAWGLAHIDDIPDDFCMVYDFMPFSAVGMFTKNTRIAVDFVFINKDKQVVKVHKNMPPLRLELARCDDANYVVELKAGQCEKNDISVGDTIQINAEDNTPMPVKCNDVVYEDDKIILTKIWTCPKRSIFTDKEDHNHKRLFLHNWNALTYIDLDGNFLYRRKKENERDGVPVKPKFNPEWLRVKKHDETDFDKDGWKIIIDVDEKLGRRLAKIVDRNGNEKFPSKYSYIGSERNGHRAVWIDGPDIENPHVGRKLGFVDSNGKEIVPCGEYEAITDSYCEDAKLFGFKENGKWGISDFNGNIVVEPRYGQINLWENWGLAHVQDEDNTSAKKGLMTLNGKMVLPIKYDKIYGLVDNYIMCHTNCKTEMFVVKVKNDA